MFTFVITSRNVFRIRSGGECAMDVYIRYFEEIDNWILSGFYIYYTVFLSQTLRIVHFQISNCVDDQFFIATSELDVISNA